MRTNAAFNFLGFVVMVGSVIAGPSVIEVGPDQTDKLPKGKEADGIIGDFLMRNDRVEVLISHNAPLRRANMSTFYGDGGVTPGCLYDLSLLGTDNDQITIFSPSGQRGRVSYVRIVEGDPVPGEPAVVETVTTASNNKGLTIRHEYQLYDGEQGVRIVTTLRNDGNELHKGSVKDEWTRFSSTGTFQGIHWADAVDPGDRAGYAYAWEIGDGWVAPPDEVELAPGDELRIARFLAVGRSPAEAFGVVARRHGETGTLTVRAINADGDGVTGVEVSVLHGASAEDEQTVVGYTGQGGEATLQLPEGNYRVRLEANGHKTVERTVALASGGEAAIEAAVGNRSSVAFDIREGAGKSLPCKAQFIGLGETKDPNLGPDNRAHGCSNQYHSESGQFSVALPPGRYRVVVTRGIEYSHLSREVTLESGQTLRLSGYLHRLVDTTGWVSSDFHNHSTPSGDNTCGTDDRIINLAAEHIEYAPTTEHNRLYDWTTHIERLGLTKELNTVPGIELTGSGAHFNAFPFKPQPFTQDWGAPVWQKDPRLNAIVLRDFQGLDPSRWVHINHPDLSENFIDRDADGVVDNGFLGLGALVEGFETQNGNRADILSGVPYRILREAGGKESFRQVREFIWLQLLNQGHRLLGVAVSDAHSVFGNGVGGWRQYVKSSTDAPADISWKEISRQSRAGRIVLTTGPFLEVSTEDGVLPGGDVRAAGSVRLKVRVQCTDWIDINRVQVLVNGRQVPELNYTRQSHPDWFTAGVVKFDRTLDVPLQRDSHLIVVATGEGLDLSTGFGKSPQSNLAPCAYHNPIFVDVDGYGFQPNGDTLDYPLPVGGLEPNDVKRMLGLDVVEDEETEETDEG